MAAHALNLNLMLPARRTRHGKSGYPLNCPRTPWGNREFVTVLAAAAIADGSQDDVRPPVRPRCGTSSSRPRSASGSSAAAPYAALFRRPQTQLPRTAALRRCCAGSCSCCTRGSRWEFLPQELGPGFESGMTCWRRPRDWYRAGSGSSCTRRCWRSRTRPGALDWSRTVAGSSHVRGVKGGPEPDRVRPAVPGWARSTT
jgi:hypothetical protein